MIIDDERDVLATLAQGLENEGFEVHSFSDPISALEHVEAGCKDCELAVCDVNMPKMTGFQLARRIREFSSDMRIIFMTAFELNKHEFDSVFPSTEIENVILKPFTPSHLAEIIKESYRQQEVS